MSAESYVDGRRRRKRAGQYGHGWLAGLIPADARRYRVVDPALAGALGYVDAELVRGAAEVEIAPAREDAFGDADIAIVSLDPPPRTRRPLFVRAGRRLFATIRTRIRAAVARHDLRRLGYGHTSVLLWDVGQRARLPGIPTPELNLAERLPERALVVGRRGPQRRTVLEAVIEAAGREVGSALEPRWASIRSGTLIVATDGGLLRVAVGYSRSQIENHVAALRALGEAGFSPIVADRIPWLLAHGRVGFADWSLERMLPGVRPPRALGPTLLGDCVEFLVALHSASAGQTAGRSPRELADTVASVSRPGSAEVARAVADRLERELAGVPRGIGHGDFFAGNLLASNGTLSGVIDWDAGGSGRLPLIDLLHLELTRLDYGFDHEWGGAVVDRLLPLARSGGDEVLRGYCAKLGVEADPRLLESLTVAYWLEYVAYQLRTHLERHTQSEWIEGNVEGVLRKLESFAAGEPVTERRPRTVGSRAAR